jgi:hypothetical protein
MNACCRLNEKHLIEKTWTQFKSHFAAAHCQHKQMQGESAATAGYHSANANVGKLKFNWQKPPLEHWLASPW